MINDIIKKYEIKKNEDRSKGLVISGADNRLFLIPFESCIVVKPDTQSGKRLFGYAEPMEKEFIQANGEKLKRYVDLHTDQMTVLHVQENMNCRDCTYPCMHPFL